jgi:hypothetical protein
MASNSVLSGAALRGLIIGAIWFFAPRPPTPGGWTRGVAFSVSRAY